MEFSRRKIPVSTDIELSRCPVSSMEALVPVYSPTYVFMKLNAKYVAIKSPLDFFTEEELTRLKEHGDLYQIYLPAGEKFKAAARAVTRILNWQPRVEASAELKLSQVSLPPAPFEISDAILRELAILWGPHLAVEPFFVSAFVTEFCGALDPAVQALRDREVAHFEVSLLRADVSIFLALHLGCRNGTLLKQLRKEILVNSITQEKPKFFGVEFLNLAQSLIPDSDTRIIEGKFLNDFNLEIAHKIYWRLKRVDRELKDSTQEMATIYGPKGFRDV